MNLRCVIDNLAGKYVLTGFYFDIDDQRIDVNETGHIGDMMNTCRLYHEQGCAIFSGNVGDKKLYRLSFRNHYGAECA